MSIKVKDIYYKIQKSIGNDIKLMAGDNGLSNIVEWFHTVERSNVASFLEGNEVVVTTGIALQEQNETLKDIISASLTNKASAIIVNTGPYIKDIPLDVIQFCNDNALPLLVCPWHIYMANILKIIVGVITHDNEKQYELISAFKNALCFPTQQDLYISSLERYDYEPEWKYCVAIIKVCNKNESTNINKEGLRKIQKQVDHVLAFNAPESITLKHRSELVICFANRNESSIFQTMSLVISNLETKYHKLYDIYSGIGRNTKSIRCLYKTYNIADKVISLQQKVKNTYQVVSYSKMGFSKLFLSMDDKEIMLEYYDEVLKPLVEYDIINKSDYVGFLEVYFNNECKAQETANQLYLHRNSVNYRLKKIEDILGFDINEFNNKVSIVIALKIRMLI
ncbi:MAG: PucR family transcriptional regulator ligand-binding domain-containing protein [Thomasclavelia sp.]|nr:PucR family transcriptional regulator ligand-binding domain-containing protein [Thomasclavelia sp.]